MFGHTPTSTIEGKIFDDKWKKEWDFTPSQGSTLKRVAYIDLRGGNNVYNKPMVRLDIYEVDGKIDLSYKHSPLDKNNLSEFCKSNKPEYFKPSQLFTIGIVTNDRAKLNEFINFVDSHNALGNEVKNKIFTYLNIENNAEKIVIEIENLIASQQISKALDVIIQSQNNQHYYIIWKFIQLFHNQPLLKISDLELFSLHFSVKKDNPHYQEALELLMLSLLKDGNRDRLQLAFKCAIDASIKNQEIIDRLFHYLRGNPASPMMNDVKFDCDTLFKIAEQMKNQAIAIQQLESLLPKQSSSAVSSFFK